MDREFLIQKYGDPAVITNGVIVQIYKDHKHLKCEAAAECLKIMTQSSTTTEYLRIKIFQIYQKAVKLRGNKLTQFNNKPFILQEASSTIQSSDNLPQDIISALPLPLPAQNQLQQETSSLQEAIFTQRSPSSPEKKLNTTFHLVRKNEKICAELHKTANTLKERIKHLKSTHCHFKIKNVKKREERNLQMRVALRQEKNKLKEHMKKQAIKIQKLQEQVDRTSQQLHIKTQDNKRLHKKVIQQKKQISELRKREQKMTACNKRRRIEMESRTDDDNFVGEDDGEDNTVVTKVDGEFTEEVRMCVMELAGLEVATGKMASVMSAIGGLCKKKFSAYPSKSTCQNIVDEGHVLAKALIAEKLKNSRAWGMHKDGTTRRKVKILDTSVCTSQGESFCLGWSAVSSETGKAIAKEAQEKLEEVSMASGGTCLLEELLIKLRYFMNDRAANEKKSSQILEIWREDCLQKYGCQNHKEVQHLFCAAHVLLGFHTYTMKEIKKLDTYSQKDFKHPIEQLLRDASDIFGPVGDYRGIRNQWEAYCIENGIRSQIKSYKDNRFNGLFEISSQVHHHHQDFIQLLQNKKNLNAKQTRLLRSLQSPELILLTECLGLFFNKVTGPYWAMVVGKRLGVKDMAPLLQKLHHTLQRCTKNTKLFMLDHTFKFLHPTSSSQDTRQILSSTIHTKDMRKLIATISSAFILTIEAQLSDFLDTGKYSGSQGQDRLQDITNFAPLTNLICERNFGHLDSSQKRRPSSSLHHHTSILLLKQMKGRIKTWYNRLDKNRKMELMQRARTVGFRKKHRLQDKMSVMECLPTTSRERPLNVEVEVEEISNESLTEGQMVAVACQDTWYPALVEGAVPPEKDEVLVNFADLGKGAGVFKWPSGRDIHIVSRKSIIEHELEYQPRAGGRMWQIINVAQVIAKFKKFN